MKRLLKIFTLCLISMMIFSLVSCSGDKNIEQNEIGDTTEMYDSISSVTTALAASLTDDQKNVVLPAEYDSNVYSITSSGNYYFSGILSNAITVAKDSGNVHIYLDAVTLSAESTNAISSKSGANVTITLIGNNVLSNIGTVKHVIDSKENLVINGAGAITIDSTKSAIACDKVFIGLGGTINVTAANHAVTADSIYLEDFVINAVSCGKDVLHAESDYDAVETAPTFDFGTGFVYIASGTINTIDVFGDAVQADSFVYIKGGTFNLTTTPTWNDEYIATENQEKGMFERSTHQKIAKDSVRAGSTYAILEESVKGIKVGEIDYYLATDTNQENELTVSSDKYTILIEGGIFTINTVDDAIHTNSGSVLVYGGDFTINTKDDAIHADTNFKIAGDATIIVETCYEGIEAKTIDISGGTTVITALDDGVNATDGNLTESQQKSICQINISGGWLDITVNPNGDRDGIDSNGGIKITGGTVITRGPNNQNASPIDAASAISISGGTVIVIGNAPGTSGGRPGGRQSGGGVEGSLTVAGDIVKTQSSSAGLSVGRHTVVIGNTTISYDNAYSYSGYTTVYASSSATIN